MRNLFAKIVFGSFTAFSFLMGIISFFHSDPTPPYFGAYIVYPFRAYSIIFFILGTVSLVVGIAYAKLKS